MSEEVLVQVADGVIEVTINRPEAKNAMSKAAAEGISAAMDRLDELRALQGLRIPLPLVDGIGRNWGLWQIAKVTENQESVIDDGTAMVIGWVIELTEFANA